MSGLSASIQSAVGDKHRDDEGLPLHGRWLFLVRACWILVTVLTVVYFIVNLPGGFVRLQTVCMSSICSNSDLTPKSIMELKALGLSASFFAAYITSVGIISALVWLVVGTIIFWRKSDDRMALYAAFALVTFGGMVVASIGFPDTLSTRSLAWELLSSFLYFLGEIFIFLFFYLFPNGQFVPRWTMLPSIIVIVFFGCVIFFPTLPFSSWLNAFASVWLASFLALGVFAQLYRYKRVSTPMRRQQTKWVVFGLTAAVIGYEGAHLVLPALHLPTVIFVPLIITAILFSLLLIPLSMGLAILRYRLWNIDVIINRALVYATLTALLAVIYAGCVIGLQFLLSGFTAGNDLAIVASTLAIAALFQPLRHRLQQDIDRRFYRRKYDAARTLAAFSATLRNEVDLDQLREELVAVVQETMQPTHVSLWLRTPEPSRRQHTQLLPRIEEVEKQAP